MNGLFYMIILTYTPNERDIIQNAPNPLFRVFNEIPKEGVHLLQKYLFLSFETMSKRQHD